MQGPSINPERRGYKSNCIQPLQHYTKYEPLCAGNSPVTNEFPWQMPVTRSFDIFFDLRLNKRLGKLSRRWWFETPWHPLWRHCDVLGVHRIVCSVRLYIIFTHDGQRINTSTPGKYERNLSIVQANFSEWWLRYLLWNYHRMGIMRHCFSKVNTGSGSGLVPSDNKPLPEPMLTQIYVAKQRHYGLNP